MFEARKLSHSYVPGLRPVLQDLDFIVAEGEIFGFLGLTGSGKSTLHKILAGILREYGGMVLFAGKDLQDWDRTFFTRVGVVFQRPEHFRKLTCLENLRHVGRLYGGGQAPEAMLEWAGLSREAATRAGELSPEQSKRLGLARALAHRPQALLIDEPDAGCADLLRSQRDAGRTVILFSSDKALASDLCDRVGILDGGRLLAAMRPHELPGVRK